MLEFENSLWSQGYKNICGVDEVGRGAFAGPLVAGAVIIKKEISLPDKIIIRDSKKMTALQRDKSSEFIKNNFVFGLGEASVEEINSFGIMPATYLAFERAISNLKVQIDYLLLDAFALPSFDTQKQKAITKGDSLSISIAAASIVAKVYRDNLMQVLSSKFECYDWYSNKGYGTQKHREAIIKHGTCEHHRRDFVRNLIP